ncbi:hypothetical protein Cni_G29207 [Canna indica]|uniref:Uncharacterized protein n=1 Tax=Canna indica TaxID=4628 RepID=A0AAQ3LB72_9LILI|nr:hypothetical protein Cni_G29207 [Canna indica]
MVLPGASSRPPAKDSFTRKAPSLNISRDSSDLRATRSLNLYTHQKSFRIDGSVEGEVDILRRSLGLDGPEEFAIPLAEWEKRKGLYENNGGGANVVASGYTKGDGLGAEIMGTFILVYTAFSATDDKRSARDSHVPILAPLPIGFAVFLVHLATIPITGTGINPARSLGAAIIYNKDHAWDDHWIFWAGPFIGAALAAMYHQIVIRAIPFKSRFKRKIRSWMRSVHLGWCMKGSTRGLKNIYLSRTCHTRFPCISLSKESLFYNVPPGAMQSYIELMESQWMQCKVNFDSSHFV